MKINRWVQPNIQGYKVTGMTGKSKAIAERILMIIPKEGFFEYTSVEELDRRIMWAYWQKFDGLENGQMSKSFFLERATYPDRIKRVLRKMEELMIISIKPAVRARANEHARQYRQELGYKGGGNLGE